MTVAIVGAGLAGLRTAETLRAEGFDGRIVLIGAEPHPPYSRPPLSKDVLRGDSEPATATLRSSADIESLDLELRLGCTAAALRVAAREVVLTDATTIRYQQVVVATGAAPRLLPGPQPGGLHVLRTVDDCLALRTSLGSGVKLVVVGAGFIGLEVAASARALDCDVTVVDVLPAPLDRVLDASIGAALQAMHTTHGVKFRLGVGVAGFDGGERSARVLLSDGTSLPADVVVVGIGAAPSTGWLAGSGLALDDGVVCDETLCAAPDVWAAGDVARWRRPAGGTIRVEHWTNATEQPVTVARNILGERQPFETVPYFWSDQYDAKLQSLGAVTKGDETVVVRGSLEEPKWVALVRDGDKLGGVVGLRSARDVMKLRPLLVAGAAWRDALDAAATG